jgi:hypothetical protein
MNCGITRRNPALFRAGVLGAIWSASLAFGEQPQSVLSFRGEFGEQDTEVSLQTHGIATQTGRVFHLEGKRLRVVLQRRHDWQLDDKARTWERSREVTATRTIAFSMKEISKRSMVLSGPTPRSLIYDYATRLLNESDDDPKDFPEGDTVRPDPGLARIQLTCRTNDCIEIEEEGSILDTVICRSELTCLALQDKFPQSFEKDRVITKRTLSSKGSYRTAELFVASGNEQALLHLLRQ